MGGRIDKGVSPAGNPLAPIQEQLSDLSRRLGVLERGLVREDTPQPVEPVLDFYVINPGDPAQIVTAKVTTQSAAPSWGTMWTAYRRQTRHNALLFTHYIWPVEGSITGTVRLLLNGDEIWRKSGVPGGTQDVDQVGVEVDLPIGSQASLSWQGQHDGTDLVEHLNLLISRVTWVDRDFL